MNEDSWDRARQLVEEGERKRAEEDAILAPYERITIRGTALVDGHHLLLEMLRDVDTFNDYVREHPRLGEIGKRWLDPHPVDLANVVAMSVISPLEYALPLEVAKRFTGTEKQCVESRSILDGHYKGPDQYCVVNGQTDLLVFDARMPPASDLIEKLETGRKRSSHQQVARLDIERWLKLLKSGRWKFWYDYSSGRELQYSFKNAFLNALTHSWHGWKEHLGVRKFDISDRGRFCRREKGVDARLVIAGCKAAADPEVDWACLVTNDADYVPLIEHLQSRNKAVYLLSLCDSRWQCRDLKNIVGSENVIDKADLYHGFQQEPVLERFRSKPALITLLVHCALPHIGSQLGGICEEMLDPVKHMEFLKGYEDIL